MSALDLPTHGQRSVWVFQTRLSEEAVKALDLAKSFGLNHAPDEDFIEYFQAETLKEYGFARYLSEANGFEVPEAERLDALTGTVFLMFSQALEAETGPLTPAPEFTLIGRYDTTAATPNFEKLESESARGQLAGGKPAKSDARMSGMVATFVLIFLALFVALFVWIA